MRESKIITRKFLNLICNHFRIFELCNLASCLSSHENKIEVKYEEKQPSHFNDRFIVSLYYYLPNIARSLRVSIFHSLECFFSVFSSCFKIPYNVSFTHLQTFSTTLAMKSKIEHRGKYQ